MKFRTDDPYDYNVFTVKQYGEHTVRITYCSAVRQKGWEDDRIGVKKGSVNEQKLINNLARAKGTVRELALCNQWDYWCTFTINPDKYDRYDLDTYMRDFAMFLNNYNKYKCPSEYKVKYLLVPEQHKDGAWHLHGFIRGIKPSDLYINEHGYLTWKQYEKKFGYISMSKINNMDRCSSYILKYMTKDADKNVSDLHKHLYYASQGLERAVELYKGKGTYKGTWDWEHPDGYCKVKSIDVRSTDISDYLEVDNDGR